MQTLVTGGAGFIGSALVDRLLRQGHLVTVVDDFSRGRRANLEAALVAYGQALRVVALDIRDPGLSGVVAQAQPDVVFHLAAQIDVRASVANPAHDADVNILGTINLAQAACAAGVRKIVFASSGGSIYGDTPELPATETTALQPLSAYAVAKVAAELYLNTFSRLYGVQCSHLAFANVYGPRQDPHGEAGVVAIFARAMLDGGQTRLFGDGGNTRDYVYVDDVVSALTMAAGDVGDRLRLNIGTGQETSDREMHRLVARAVGCPDEPTFGPARPGDVRRSSLNGSLALDTIGWKPEHDLIRGIQLTVDSFRR